jgi:type IV pilus assembly protein PilE
MGGLQASGDERMARRDWRQTPTVARIVKSFTIGTMVAARVHRSRGRRAIGGFTLIEVMIVVVVIGVLAAIALPSFLDSVRKSRRADAITELNKVAQAQERWRANNPNFNNADVSTAATGLGLYGATLATSYTLNSGYYSIAIGTAAASPTDYTVTATAAGAQVGDTTCAVLRLIMTGGNLGNWAGSSVATLANAATDANARKCWSRR